MLTNHWGTAIDDWATAARAGGAPTTTLTTRRQHLAHLGARIGGGPWDVTTETLLTFCGGQSWSAETRRGRRSTFRAFYAWAVTAGHIDASPAAGLPSVKAGKPRPRPCPPRVYKAALLAAARRERLMLRLACEHGLRRAEVACGHSDDLWEDLGGWTLTVHGKGGKDRDIPLLASIAAELRQLPHGYFFPGDDGGHLSPRWVGKLMTRLLPGDWTMHTLRHRFATNAYAHEKDLFTVQELLGHASPATTRVYVHVPREALRRTIEAIAA
ncbi:tyrosine-type recombinase/integrase [Tersicoccus sp. Bi-70]|uniref:tyrosine-type recombinase/integrase n=1 Tax=Tersicoccus sp. Bi-70 TaxID=1897634 RepID=UPI0009770737|nr:tyrosine-type recombinase/integrase [Tersicoccus sp. Bi-70]OMH30673.1 integrase [Tersicoccus sp. Bi-70]